MDEDRTMIGSMIGQYKVLALLGEGGMGRVYKAVDVNLDRPVALKFLNSNLDTRPEMLERFRAEARTHASLHHPNIAMLYAFLVWEGKAVMVMEYIEGETLHDRIQRVGKIPVGEAVPLIQQALLGLAAAHHRGIVHRDIKPQNLMIDREGVLKVMDFGIAKVLGKQGLTSTNMMMGTFWYMSPEQIRGRAVDARTDIYSMGVTLYEVLTGRVPFDANSDYEIQRAHIEQTPALPNVHNPLVPEYLALATMRALAKEPADRFPAAEDFHAALASRRGETYTELPAFHPGTVVEQPRATIPESTARYKEPAASANVTPEPDAPRSHAPWWIGIAAVVLVAAGGAAWFFHSREPAKQPAHAPTEPSNGGTAGYTTPAPPPPIDPGNHRHKVIPQPRPDPGTTQTATTSKVPPVKPILPPHVETGLSGTWKGAFTDADSQASTPVVLTLAGKPSEDLRGSLSFAKNTPDEGDCKVDPRHSSFDAATHQLVLAVNNCSHPTQHSWLHVPVHFTVNAADTRLTDAYPMLPVHSFKGDLTKQE